MRRHNQAAHVAHSQVPEPNTAIRMFEAHGRHLTLFSPFGEDPLVGQPRLAAEREAVFHQQYPDFAPFFHTIVNGDNSLFKDGLLYFIQISRHYLDEMQRVT